MQDLADHHVEQPVAAANFLLDSFSEEDKSKMKVALADKRTLDSLVKAAAEQAAHLRHLLAAGPTEENVAPEPARRPPSVRARLRNGRFV